MAILIKITAKLIKMANVLTKLCLIEAVFQMLVSLVQGCQVSKLAVRMISVRSFVPSFVPPSLLPSLPPSPPLTPLPSLASPSLLPSPSLPLPLPFPSPPPVPFPPLHCRLLPPHRPSVAPPFMASSNERKNFFRYYRCS
jgi:hypothetical protein